MPRPPEPPESAERPGSPTSGTDSATDVVDPVADPVVDPVADPSGGAVADPVGGAGATPESARTAQAVPAIDEALTISGPEGAAAAGEDDRHRPLLGPPHRPFTSRKWVPRAEGDRRSRARLRFLEGEGVIVLNDRRIPGSPSSIRVIAISSAGVFVIDAKNYKGLVHTRRQGTIRNLGPLELHVGRRNCTPSVEQLAEQLGIVRQALNSTPWGAQVPVQAMLCLTRAEWGFASPLEISDVWIGWPKLMAGRVQAPGVMDSPTVQEVSEMIATRLP